jgi:hypothetical protein
MELNRSTIHKSKLKPKGIKEEKKTIKFFRNKMFCSAG